MSSTSPIVDLSDFTDLLAGHQGDAQIVVVPLSAISAPGPVQTRRPFDPENYDDDKNLVESIRAHGVLQPVLLGPDGDETVRRYYIIAGHRRVAASRRAGLDRVPAIVHSFEEIQVAEVGIIENLQRADLNPLEQAEQYAAFMRLSGLSVDQVSARVQVSRSSVYRSLALLDLPEELQHAVLHDRLTPHQAQTCAKVCADMPDRIEEIIEAVDTHSLSASNIEALATLVEESPDVPVSVLAREVAGTRTVREKRAAKKQRRKKEEEKTAVDYRRYTTQLDAERARSLETLAAEMQLDGVTVRRAALLLLADSRLVVPSAVVYAQQLAQTEVGQALARIEAGVERMRLVVGKNLTPSQSKAATLVLSHVVIWAQEMVALLEQTAPAVTAGD